MKKLICLFSALVCVSAVAGPPLLTQVGTDSSPILPSRQLTDATPLTNGMAVTAGSHYRVQSGEIWMALSSGTTTSQPSNQITDYTADAVSWRRSFPGTRKAFWISNVSTQTLYLSISYPAEIGKGIVVPANGYFQLDEGAFQDRINGVFPNAVGNVGSVEL